MVARAGGDDGNGAASVIESPASTVLASGTLDRERGRIRLPVSSAAAGHVSLDGLGRASDVVASHEPAIGRECHALSLRRWRGVGQLEAVQVDRVPRSPWVLTLGSR